MGYDRLKKKVRYFKASLREAVDSKLKNIHSIMLKCFKSKFNQGGKQ